MELDEFKQSWKQSNKDLKPLNSNIMELIQNKSNGPVALLKRRFKKQMVVIPIIVAILVNNLSRKHDIFSDGLFWLYILFCLVMFAYFFTNYRLMQKMECMDCMVKSNLEKQVELLQKNFRQRRLFVRIMAVVFIVLFEVLMYFRLEPSMVKWYVQPVMLRLAVYVGGWLLFYLLTRFALSYKYERHINRLKELVEQLQ